MADDDTKQVEVLFGPYAGHVLTMSAADADAAIGAQWAIEPRMPPIDPDAAPLPDLSPEQRAAAELAAETWAADVRGDPVPNPGGDDEASDGSDEEGAGASRRRRRHMTAGRGRGYDTK